jgi:glutamyl-tRNA synthetase
MSEVRVRFAPSPTGYLHVGGARTALFNYLFAKKMGGKFLLRIEDTDRSRYHEGALAEIFTSLRWLGLDWDEGPEAAGENGDGDFGPYFQSERTDLYKKYADDLLERGLAYRCFCTSERLTELRAEQEEKADGIMGYDNRCRHLSDAQIAKNLDADMPFVVRLAIPENETISFVDVIRGEISFDSSTQDDFVLLKSDGFPTYHLANVIDDHYMKISHVLRGDEWITSAPKHLLLYKAFGWEAPQIAHLPVILSETGGKLSKRKGAASVMDYQKEGFLSPALFNFLALLGWNPGDDREIMSIDEMVEAFSLDRVTAKPSVFDTTKLEWMNGQYLATTPAKELLDMVVPALKELAYIDDYANMETVEKIVTLMKDRSRRITEIAPSCKYFFLAPIEYDPKTLKKATKGGKAVELMNALAAKIDSLVNFSAEAIEAEIKATVEENEVGFGKVGQPARLAITGIGGGPSMHDIMAIIGKDESLSRLNSFCDFINKELGEQE